MFRIISFLMFSSFLILSSCIKTDNIEVDFDPFDDGKVGIFYDLFEIEDEDEDEA